MGVLIIQPFIYLLIPQKQKSYDKNVKYHPYFTESTMYIPKKLNPKHSGGIFLFKHFLKQNTLTLNKSHRKPRTEILTFTHLFC